MSVRTYCGTRHGPGQTTVTVLERVNRHSLAGERRLLRHRVHHSPDGFEWGYAGSGPAELARCLLWDLTGEEPAPDLHQAFKHDVIAELDGDAWELTDTEIRDWLTQTDVVRTTQQEEHEMTTIQDRVPPALQAKIDGAIAMADQLAGDVVALAELASEVDRAWDGLASTDHPDQPGDGDLDLMVRAGYTTLSGKIHALADALSCFQRTHGYVVLADARQTFGLDVPPAEGGEVGR